MRLGREFADRIRWVAFLTVRCTQPTPLVVERTSFPPTPAAPHGYGVINTSMSTDHDPPEGSWARAATALGWDGRE